MPVLTSVRHASQDIICNCVSSLQNYMHVSRMNTRPRDGILLSAHLPRCECKLHGDQSGPTYPSETQESKPSSLDDKHQLTQHGGGRLGGLCTVIG